MNDTLYRGVRMALGDADPKFSKMFTGAFFPLGLRDIATCADRTELVEAVATAVDIVACSVDLPEIDFLQLSQDIRHGRVGSNPFAVLIAIGQPTDAGAIARILEAGVDDLIIKPADAEILVKRINAFTRERKPFVVTPGYVGPSRRPARRNDGSDDENTIDVPNTLRARVVQGRDTVDLVKMIEAGRSTMSDKKAQTGIRVIARLTRRVAQLQEDVAQAEELRRVLRTLTLKAGEVVVEHRNSEATRHVAEIAERFARLSQKAEAMQPRPPKNEVSLLLQLSDAAVAAFLEVRGTAGAVPEIVAIVDKYLTRD